MGGVPTVRVVPTSAAVVGRGPLPDESGRLFVAVPPVAPKCELHPNSDADVVVVDLFQLSF